MLNQRSDRSTKRGAIIERALGLDIGPGLDREETLSAIDVALSRIDGVLAELGSERESGSDSRFAFRKFMDRLRRPIASQGERVEVLEGSAYMQIRSRVNGHRIYISKGKTSVGRVESTIPLGYINGSIQPTHHNGNIKSWMPAEVGLVSKAIELLGMERLPTLV